jgi:CRISPR/Cas system CSM-associated protein Csm4 (group 5 of RAMP superfamily)
MSDIESELRKLVSSYGYQKINDSLQSMMKTEYAYLSKLFQVAQPLIVHPAPSTTVAVEPVKKQKKIKKVKIIDEPKAEEPINTLVLEEDIKDIIVSNPNPAYRDPKQIKEFQKIEEEKKRKENEEAGIELSQILTKENLKQWIEIEGHTYAWVAREKAGCKESQIAAMAQMMGIRSRITKKKALIMSGR